MLLGLETLPFELQRNFQLMRQLDQRSEDLKVMCILCKNWFVFHIVAVGCKCLVEHSK